MKGYYPSTRQNEHSLNPSKLSGITLAEVVVSISIISLVSASVAYGFIALQKAAMFNAYYTGAQRVLQGHVERLNSVPTQFISNQSIVNYNYSGLKVTSLGDESSQTNLESRTKTGFVVYTNNFVSNTFNPVRIVTNSVEDAVLAYSTIILTKNDVTLPASDLFGPGTVDLSAQSFIGQNLNHTFKVALIRTLWEYDGRTITNQAVVIKPQ